MTSAPRPSIYPPDTMEWPDSRRRDYEAGRAYGRYETESAINWMTSCIGCAQQLDQRVAGHFQGEQAGLSAALRAIQEATSIDPATQAVVDVLAAKVRRLLAGYYEGEPREATLAHPIRPLG